MRPLLLFLGLLALSLPVSASFFPGYADNSGKLVLAVFTGSDSAAPLAAPPVPLQLSTCQSSPYSPDIPELASFKVTGSSPSFTLSYGCQATTCDNCAGSISITADSETLAPFNQYKAMIYNANPEAKTLTTYVYTDPSCSTFVWPSTPLVSSSGQCLKSNYFDGNLASSYWSVLLLSNAYYSISAHCADKGCTNCLYGGIGQLLPTPAANNCSSIVIGASNYTFFVEAELGKDNQWDKGRIVTVAIGIGAAGALLLVSIVIVMRSLRGGYNRIN